MKLFRFFIVFFLTFPLTSFAFEKGIEDLKARVDYARLMEDEGNYKEASKEYTRIINYYPGYEKLDYIRYKRGKSQYMAGTFKEALIDFNYIIDIEKEVEKGSVIYKNSKIFIKKILSKKTKTNKKKKHKIKRTSSEQKLKAVQIFQFHAQTLEEVDAEFQYLKREGVNTVIVRVFQNLSDRPFAFFDSDDSDEEKGVYFQTDYVPVVEDVLGDIVKIAKKNNLKVFAWMTTRYANYGLENVYDIRCRAWNVKTKDYEFCKGYDLFDGKVAKRLSGIFKDLAKYDIDGILFQDDFVLRHLEGFTEDAQYKYKKTTGRSLNPENLYIVNKETGKVTYKEEYWKWASFKNKYLMTLARHLMKEARTVNPDLKFAVNLMYETLTNPSGALAWLSQDIKEAKKAGFEYFSVMAYHRQMGKELNKDLNEIKEVMEDMVDEAMSEINDPSRILMKIQTVDWDSGRKIDNKEISIFVDIIQNRANMSIAFAPYRKGLPFINFRGKIKLGKQQESSSKNRL